MHIITFTEAYLAETNRTRPYSTVIKRIKPFQTLPDGTCND